ncbi:MULTISPECIES: caspase family protein [unclassified Ruegeria]|uniref:caspase family protein n=1 Tax=unclassified Ruegeria TaxID=2625375 RepID=UPI00148795F6|nr:MULTISPECIES: caspase family protein [unclassified Ruegeria]
MTRILMVFFMVTVLFAGPSSAHERFALVIGNAGYTNVPALDNPVNDARLMSDELQAAGFSVTTLTDVGRADMMQEVDAFASKVRAAGSEALAVFYFAGHGVRSDGFNYLLPLNVNIQTEADIAGEAVPAEWILDRIHTPKAVSVMILDACRDNPFGSQADVFGDVGDGLARMTARTNNLIAYATGPGDVALDGTGTNSPYTAAIARAIRTTDLGLEQMFEQVRSDVVSETEGLQSPWARSSLNIRIGLKDPNAS